MDKSWLFDYFLNIKFPISITIRKSIILLEHYWQITKSLLHYYCFDLSEAFQAFLQFTVKVFSLQVSVLSSSVFFENDALALTAKMSVDNMKDSRKKSFAAMTVNTDREVKIVGLGSLLQVLLRLPMLLPIAIWRKPRIYDFTAFVEYKRKGSWN